MKKNTFASIIMPQVTPQFLTELVVFTTCFMILTTWAGQDFLSVYLQPRQVAIVDLVLHNRVDEPRKARMSSDEPENTARGCSGIFECGWLRCESVSLQLD